MKGFHFKTYEAPEQSPFDRLFEIFKELIVHTSGDFDETISWMRELDVEYKLTDEKYTIDDFIEDLKKKGYIKEEIQQDGNGETKITSKTERAIRQQALNNIFGNLQKAGKGNHKTKTLEKYLQENNITPQQVLYMGDDLPDYKVMQQVVMPCCPQDAVPEIKALSKYVSHLKGGKGCVRDVIEQVLKVQEKWNYSTTISAKYD